MRHSWAEPAEDDPVWQVGPWLDRRVCRRCGLYRTRTPRVGAPYFYFRIVWSRRREPVPLEPRTTELAGDALGWAVRDHLRMPNIVSIEVSDGAKVVVTYRPTPVRGGPHRYVKVPKEGPIVTRAPECRP